MPRSSDYTDEIADEICGLLAEGLSLVKICKLERMPHRATVIRWMGENADFATKCARVREGAQSDYVFDDIARIEDGVESGQIDPNAARVLISSKQWRAAKLAPKKYGDKTTIAGDAENPIAVKDVSDTDRAAALLAFLARTKGA